MRSGEDSRGLRSYEIEKLMDMFEELLKEEIISEMTRNDFKVLKMKRLR